MDNKRVDLILSIPITVSIDQITATKTPEPINPETTLRKVYQKAGKLYCPECLRYLCELPTGKCVRSDHADTLGDACHDFHKNLYAKVFLGEVIK